MFSGNFLTVVSGGPDACGEVVVDADGFGSFHFCVYVCVFLFPFGKTFLVPINIYDYSKFSVNCKKFLVFLYDWAICVIELRIFDLLLRKKVKSS